MSQSQLVERRKNFNTGIGIARSAEGSGSVEVISLTSIMEDNQTIEKKTNVVTNPYLIFYLNSLNLPPTGSIFRLPTFFRTLPSHPRRNGGAAGWTPRRERRANCRRGGDVDEVGDAVHDATSPADAGPDAVVLNANL